MKQKSNSPVFKVGAICLIFLIIGYQVALFVSKAAALKIAANRDQADTVYIVKYIQHPESANADAGTSTPRIDTVRREAEHAPLVQAARGRTRRTETFAFNPNTASQSELQRLGFSEKQAAAIIKYREKGGRFRRKSDFARSFVVADSVYRRLEAYIEIPLIDINKADSAAFDGLPGIGGYYAAQMIAFREKLGGYSHIGQLLDIYNFGQERFDGLSDLIFCSPPEPYPLWTLDVEELRQHPYISSYQVARGIVRFRDNVPAEELSVQGLIDAGVISASQGEKLSKCLIEGSKI